jgi:FlaA1/EpsC-like NDP-sugar epimerase
VFGSGEAALKIVGEIKAGGAGLEAVVIADDDRKHEGGSLLGVGIEGSRADIRLLSRRYQIDEIIIAKPMATQRHLSLILAECIKTRCDIKMLPLYRSRKEAEDGAAELSILRKPEVTDLLGRDRPKVDHREIGDQLKGRIVMVIGAAGVFGSELSLQLLRYRPRRIVAVDMAEDGLVLLQQSLEKAGKGETEIKTVLASTRDAIAMREIFEENKPHIVYYAAELKQIPLAQLSAREAYLTNVVALASVASLAEEYSAMRFIHVSSTRAGHPDTVYSGLKRFGELIVSRRDEQSLATFASVRLPNLIEGKANVVALFEKQIESGGPVTVIDKGFTKDFIKTSEAVLLAIEAGMAAKGGETFVIGSGVSIGITELAESMIRLSGHIPNEDIAISVAQLRPGERNGLLPAEASASPLLIETNYDRVLLATPDESLHVPLNPEPELSSEDVAKLLKDLFDRSMRDKSTVFRGVPSEDEIVEAFQ